jgi:hypothetical protein
MEEYRRALESVATFPSLMETIRKMGVVGFPKGILPNGSTIIQSLLDEKTRIEQIFSSTLKKDGFKKENENDNKNESI